MTKRSEARKMRRICIPAALLLGGVCLLSCVRPTDTAVPATPAAPVSTPETVVIGAATPTQVLTTTPGSAAPAPDAAAAEQADTLAEAAKALNASRSPNRLKSAQIDAIVHTLPETLSLSRTLIVVKAYSLLDKVSYQWGGKSREMGWDRRWDKQTAAFGMDPDEEELSGLDCSGYVRWCFSNAAGDAFVGDRLGSGTYKQWLNSKEIAPDEVLPGDLMFTDRVGRSNHNGIVVQVDEGGGIQVIHCARDRGVVIESATDAGFLYARRPDMLSGKNLEGFEASMLRHQDEAYMADLRYLLALREW